MGTVMAAVMWQERRNGMTSMAPFVDVELAERSLASSAAHRAWLEKAVFPRYVPAYCVAHACQEVGLELRRRPRRRRPGAMFAETRDAEVVWRGEVIGVAEIVQPEGFAYPHWEVELFGATFRSGSLDCLAVEIADAIKAGPRAPVAEGARA